MTTRSTSPALRPHRSLLFLVHRVEIRGWALRWSRDLDAHPRRAWRWLWPISALASLIYLLGRRAYDVVDRCRFSDALSGETWVLRGLAWRPHSPKRRSQIQQRILTAVRDAQAEGIDVIGLGGLVKAERPTEGGRWIVDALGDALRTSIVNGDTLTAMAVIKRSEEIIKAFQLGDKPLFVTGAASEIGRAVCLWFAARGQAVMVSTRCRERFEQIRAEAGADGQLLRRAEWPDAERCGLAITCAAEKGDGERLIAHLSTGAVVLNGSVSDPLTPRLLRRRQDIIHLDGGLIAYDPEPTDLSFTARLRPGLTYACHAGAIIHAHLGWRHHEVGPVKMEALEPLWAAARGLGMRLPESTSHLEPAPEGISYAISGPVEALRLAS